MAAVVDGGDYELAFVRGVESVDCRTCGVEGRGFCGIECDAFSDLELTEGVRE